VTVAEDLVPLLARFHREVLLPDVKRVVAEAVEVSERRLRDEMQTGFNSLARELTDLRLKARVDALQEQVRILEVRPVRLLRPEDLQKHSHPLD
jgi:hypothetical protein